MIIQLQVSDAVYASLLTDTSRVKGSIGLVSPTEGNFHAYKNNPVAPKGTRTMKLPHGKVSINEEQIRMYLLVKREESTDPARTIEGESLLACDFVNFMEGMA